MTINNGVIPYVHIEVEKTWAFLLKCAGNPRLSFMDRQNALDAVMSEWSRAPIDKGTSIPWDEAIALSKKLGVEAHAALAAGYNMNNTFHDYIVETSPPAPKANALERAHKRLWSIFGR